MLTVVVSVKLLVFKATVQVILSQVWLACVSLGHFLLFNEVFFTLVGDGPVRQGDHTSAVFQ